MRNKIISSEPTVEQNLDSTIYDFVFSRGQASGMVKYYSCIRAKPRFPFDTRAHSMIRLRYLFLSILVCLQQFVSKPLSASPEDGEFTADELSFWSLQRAVRPELPAIRGQARSRSAIDQWIHKELEFASITPSEDADRRTLIRRATLDLTGLPPSLEEIASFIEDEHADAYERMIERLLASPGYGERWGRHWLDLSLFAESSGFEQDETRPNAWRYRDYVVSAFNSDKPYNRFVMEQIAGDELWSDSIEARIATGFLRHYPEEGNNKDIMLARQEILHHVTDLVGSTFLGLTFNCAQCHDHKYDPIRQSDYYRLQAFFANIGHDDKIPFASEDRLKEYEQRLAEYEHKTEHLWSEMDQLLSTVRKYSPKQLLARYPDYVIEAMSAPTGLRTPLQSQIAYIVNHKDCGTCPQRPPPHADPSFANDAKSLKDESKTRFDELKSELDQWKSLKPDDVPRASGIVDIGEIAPPTHVLGVGLYTQPRQEVAPGFLSILDAAPAKIQKPEGIPTTGRRATLAKWLVDPKNPLTARVMVNRVWHHHFGRGIVGTPSDFGAIGDPPTHPELLDWLADYFVQSGWSIKQMHRLMMTSSTYRQDSSGRGDETYDPNNRLLWRYPPQRLEAESIRDSALFVSGVLNQNLAGQSVFPPLPEGRPTPVGGWKLSPNAADHVRRSVYIFVRRNDRFPMLEVFDFPDSHEACACRNQTMTAPQALTLLNGDQPAKWADAFARRVKTEAVDDRVHQIRLANQLAFSRFPDEWELQAALEFLEKQAITLESEGLATKSNSVEERSEDRALEDYCLMLINSTEFLFRY